MARALGHRLVAPEATGLAFYALGLATPEKAYRRVQPLLPRDEWFGAWEVVSIGGQAAEICYAPAHGAETCRYRITWQSTSGVGLLTGTAIGAGVAAGLIASVGAFSASPFGLASLVSATGLAAGFAVLSGPLFGAVVDLRAQLEAVAGARRGHLALFDQVDDALAAKLDALARADDKLEGHSVSNPVRFASAGMNTRERDVAD